MLDLLAAGEDCPLRRVIGGSCNVGMTEANAGIRRCSPIYVSLLEGLEARLEDALGQHLIW
jgi:hypothetical protein